MDATAIATRVRNQIGDNDKLQVTDAMIINWINDAQRECALNNDLLQKTSITPTAVGTGSYTQPADMLKLHSIRYNGAVMDLLTLTEAQDRVDVTATSRGTPNIVYLWEKLFNFVPIPDTVVNIQILYTRTPTAVGVLSDVPELPEAYHLRLVDYCLAQVAEQDDDMERYQIKMNQFQSGTSNIRDLHETQLDTYPMITVSNRDAGLYEGDGAY